MLEDANRRSASIVREHVNVAELAAFRHNHRAFCNKGP